MQNIDEQKRVSNEYFNWMYHLVCNDTRNSGASYKKLLRHLYSITFYVIDPMDNNRRMDGIDFRYKFGYECGYSREYIKRYLNVRDCSVLEMMLALAFRGEEQIMSDSSYGNRIGQWFWSMIANLGLGKMNDRNYDEDYTNFIIFRFLNRDYYPDGNGGLFIIENAPEDLRNVQIWYQFLWYLNSVIAEEET